MRWATTRLTVNDEEVVTGVDPQTSLLLVLRNDLGLRGARAGCGIGECGACTVLVDGAAVRSCVTPLATVAGGRVITPEGLGTPDRPHAVQQAFLDEQAAQCGYCINGIIMTVAGTLADTPRASSDRLRAALSDHLCRCGTHHRVLRAAERAAGRPPAPERGSAAPAVAAHMLDARPRWDDVPADADLPPAVQRHPDVASWLLLRPNGDIEVRSGKVELGQGIRTALAQLVAAQLDVPVDHVHVVPPSTAAGPDEGYTAGSVSLEHSGASLTLMAAAFRRLLLQRAAARLGGAWDELEIAAGAVSRRATGGRVGFRELAAEGHLVGRLLPSDRYRTLAAPVGNPVGRTDLLPKLTGAPAYLHDLVMDGMVHARALLPSNPDARLVALDERLAEALPGLVRVIRDGSLVIAVAEREEQAARAVARLASGVRWTAPRLDVPASGDPASLLRALPAEPYIACPDEGVDRALAGGRRLRATYSKPYQAHGAMAPSCAVALEDGGVLRVWTHNQGVHPLRRELAALLGRDESTLVVAHVDGPGCYGHNAADDAAAFAAVAACAIPGRPVRFQFTVEQEFTWEPYGSAMVADLEAGLDETGRIVGWRQRTRTDVHGSRPNGAGDRVVPAWLRQHGRTRDWPGRTEGGARNAVPLYDIPARHVVVDYVRGPVRTGSLRSLGAFLNVFAIESFVDELAESAGQDPLAFRLAHLTDARARAVLETAAATAGWRAHVGPSGRGQGLAVSRYKGTKAYVAEVVDADVDEATGKVHVRRVVVACDAGLVVNPDGLRNQLEGGALQGLSRALHEELRLGPDGLRNPDWTTYPVLRFCDVPEIEVVLVASGDLEPLGAGEAATPPAPAALANAIDDALGVRVRRLPLTPETLRQRLLELSPEETARVRL